MFWGKNILLKIIYYWKPLKCSTCNSFSHSSSHYPLNPNASNSIDKVLWCKKLMNIYNIGFFCIHECKVSLDSTKDIFSPLPTPSFPKREVPMTSLYLPQAESGSNEMLTWSPFLLLLWISNSLITKFLLARILTFHSHLFILIILILWENFYEILLLICLKTFMNSGLFLETLTVVV